MKFAKMMLSPLWCSYIYQLAITPHCGQAPCPLLLPLSGPLHPPVHLSSLPLSHHLPPPDGVTESHFFNGLHFTTTVRDFDAQILLYGASESPFKLVHISCDTFPTSSFLLYFWVPNSFCTYPEPVLELAISLGSPGMLCYSEHC